ncbi:O-antigen ligase family protein [Saccharicrinis aurantiacus]|uniref:O-antigen ligase family protein n=1 Tax=Saccharicrinis aurantiacus TaxID=1849719 RepID=UPI0008386FD0|nr:O-antigen ligase family protein [Saccharicrinis aurantiacus]
MFEFLDKKNNQLVFIAIHVAIGYLGSVSAFFVSGFYVLIIALFFFDVLLKGDSGSRAGFYALYIVGFEIVYRISGITISAELGKYASIIILLSGMIVGKKNSSPYIFILLLVLLLPGMLLSTSESSSWTRKIIMASISGPLSLVFSGMYFYKRRVSLKAYNMGMKFVFYPSIALLVLLTFKASLANIQITTLSSNASLSGGFGPNQVSTALGWLFAVGVMELIRGNCLLRYKWLDITVCAFLLFRGLLTMSRGGIMGAFIAIIFALLIMYVIDKQSRRKINKLLMPIFVVSLFMFVGVWYANYLTNDFLLYRYQGKNGKELRTGEIDEDKSVLTGRAEFMAADIEAFKAEPFVGVGYGMSPVWHEIHTGSAAASHTEYTRLFAENGSLGVIYMLIAFLILPISHFFNLKVGSGNHFHFLVFLIISYTVMVHAAMRLAIPGVVYGAAFMSIYQNNRPKRNAKNVLPK